MEINTKLLAKAESDLGINNPYVKGQVFAVRNCWHFSSDGNDVDQLFIDEEDFRDGMNRIYVVALRYSILILAFVLMDTHVHFLLYGQFDECNMFIHDYLKRTSHYISVKYGERKKLENVSVNHQTVDSDSYLKTVICYIIRNPTVAGMRYLPYNYPYSSGALYFSVKDIWTTPLWDCRFGQYSAKERYGPYAFKQLIRTKDDIDVDVKMTDGMVFPGEYVAYHLVEKVFRSCRSFLYYMGRTKETDVDSKEGSISYLTIPMQEMRQNRTEVMREMFNSSSIRQLKTEQRIKLAKVLRGRYNSSLKQIVRICGLKYDEVKDYF